MIVLNRHSNLPRQHQIPADAGIHIRAASCHAAGVLKRFAAGVVKAIDTFG